MGEILMKKILLTTFVALLLVLMAACSDSADSSAAPEEPIGGDLQIATVIFDFSNGSPEGNLRQETVNSYEDITPEDLADALSSISGLDFFVTVSFGEDGGIIVDWAANSTLIANLDDREQKEGFHFYDADSLRWFMMDSLWRTYTENYNTDVYYTMDGGKEFYIEELYPINSFPIDAPFMGSVFFYEHTGANEEDGTPSLATTGTLIDADTAMNLVVEALSDRMVDGTAVASTGENEVYGVHCWTFAFGDNTPEKFTAMEHYAVTDYGEILVLDILANEYNLL
jgi:hypothetical protein